jgi:PEP-CTERM motif-containing protein
MKRFRSLLAPSLAIACLLAAGTMAKADSLSIVLDEAYQSGLPGDVIAFDATVTNTSSATENLNGDNFSVDSTDLTVDDSPFDDTSVWPLTLGAGDSVSGLLFYVDIDPDAALGLDTGTFEILGGHYSTNEQFVIGSADFNVNVTPEPSSLWLLLSGMVGLGATLRRRLLTR